MSIAEGITGIRSKQSMQSDYKGKAMNEQQHFKNMVEGYIGLNMLETAADECLHRVELHPDDSELLVYSAGRFPWDLRSRSIAFCRRLTAISGITPMSSRCEKPGRRCWLWKNATTKR
jgi:hypothetical protein